MPFIARDSERGWEIAFHRGNESVPFRGGYDFLSFIVFLKVAVPDFQRLNIAERITL